MITRYTRAFIGALKMTLRGQRPPEPKYPALRLWMERAAVLVEAVYAAADTAGMNQRARQALKLKLDGRLISAETILATVLHHMREEYPYLIRHETAHNLTAIYASNLNDRYWVSSLPDSLDSEGLKQAVIALAVHLGDIPPSNTL